MITMKLVEAEEFHDAQDLVQVLVALIAMARALAGEDAAIDVGGDVPVGCGGIASLYRREDYDGEFIIELSERGMPEPPQGFNE